MCGNPVKAPNYSILYTVQPNAQTPDIEKYEDVSEYYKDYNMMLQQMQKEVKILCPNCKFLFDAIFKYRLENMQKLTEECQHLFAVIKREPPDVKKKKK